MGLYGSKPESLDESPPLEEIVDHHGETSVADDAVIDTGSSPLNESLSQETGDNIFSDLPPATQIALWKKALHDISIHEIITPPSTILSFEFDYTTKAEYITLAIRLCPILAAWETELSEDSGTSGLPIEEFWRRLFFSLQLRLDDYMSVLQVTGALSSIKDSAVLATNSASGPHTLTHQQQNHNQTHHNHHQNHVHHHNHDNLPSASAMASNTASTAAATHTPSDTLSDATHSMGIPASTALTLARALLQSLEVSCSIQCIACRVALPLNIAAVNAAGLMRTGSNSNVVKGNGDVSSPSGNVSPATSSESGNVSVADAVRLVQALEEGDVREDVLELYSRVMAGNEREERPELADKVHVCMKHNGVWELDKSGKEFREFPDELKNNLRQEKRKRLTQVFSELKWIPDEDSPELSTGTWTCCGSDGYSTKGCKQIEQHDWCLIRARPSVEWSTGKGNS